MNREAHPERSPLQSMPIPQVCVIGAGYWGQNLIRNFHQLGALAMVCDARPEVLARLQEAYPQLTLVQTLEEALEQAPALGIVSMVVATPSVTHYAVGSAVLNAGFHVYIEKPLATSLVDAQALVSLAEKKHLKLMVGHLLMYHPAVIRIKELIDQGRLGTLRYLQSDRLNFNVPRADRNALWDLAVHDLAMLDCLLPQYPLSVVTASGVASGLHGKDAKVDMVQATLRYGQAGDNAPMAMLQCSWLYPIKQVRFMVVGDEASVVLDDTLPIDRRLSVYTRLADGTVQSEALPYLPLEPLKLECQHWLNCLRYDEQIPQSHQANALAVVRLLEEIQAHFPE